MVVREVNVAPVLAALPDVVVNELTTLYVAVLAADPDAGQVVTYSLGGRLPEGAAINPITGEFSFRTTEAEGPSTNIITVIATDNGVPQASATNSFRVIVNEVNTAPVLIVPDTQTIHAGGMLTVTNTAMDSDIPANGLAFGIVSAPLGVVIDPLTGILTWTPSAGQVGSNTITVIVTDHNPWAASSQSMASTNSFAVIVDAPGIPLLTLQPVSQGVGVGESVTFTVAATSDPAPGYQWRFNGINLTNGDHVSGASMTNLTISNVQTNDQGSYSVVVANSYGSVTSAVASLTVTSQAGGSWIMTGELSMGRAAHTATLLQNGKVLIVGGVDNNGTELSTAEIYDPATGTWMATGGMLQERRDHSATMLMNGKVLVAGGRPAVMVPGAAYIDSSELYDPAKGTWKATGRMNSGHSWHRATLLANGKVLVTGGSGQGTFSVSSAELYDPATERWTITTSMGSPRWGHTSTLLPDGKVLVAGGWSGTNFSGSEIYDPASAEWSTTGLMYDGRYGHTATLLSNGTVLVAGGSPWGDPEACEIYEPTSRHWNKTGSVVNMGWIDSAQLLPNGKVIVTGEAAAYRYNSMLYDPGSGIWASTSSMNFDREASSATLLPNGRVLVAGGYNSSAGYLRSAELFSYSADTPPPQLQIGWSNGLVQLKLFGSVGNTYVLQASTNLLYWQPTSTNAIPPSGVALWSESAINHSRRFYRLVNP